MEIYFDNSATTKPCKQAVDAMVKAMEDGYYNPSALYAPAMHVEQELMKARRTLAKSVDADEKAVVFTSGGTESNHLAIVGYMAGQRGSGVILYSAAEHPAVKNACIEAAALYGHTAREIPLTTAGTMDLPALEEMLDEAVRLICVMQVCNETGVVMPLAEIAALRNALSPKAAIHVDGVQGYLRFPFSLKTTGIQTYAVSAHKIHGSKGVGALMLGKGHKIRPVMLGGGQESGQRGGTENTAGIAGFQAAVENYPPCAEADISMRTMKMHMVQALQKEIPGVVVHGMPIESGDSAGHILSIAFPPVRAETLMHALEGDGVIVGIGSACSSKKGKRSAVLTAMKVPPEQIDATVRISFSHQNTMAEAAYATECIIKQYQLLQKFTRR